MRSAAIVMAAEYVAAGGEHGRSVVARALQRADEPAEMLGYWLTTPRPQHPDAGQARRRRRRAPPLHGARRAALRRPVAPDPHGRRASSSPTRRRATTAQSALFKLPARPSSPRRRARRRRRCCRCWLPRPRSTRSRSTTRRAVLRERGPAALAEAGFSWERLSGWLPGGMDAEAWEAVIPSMGVMALVRNLRNFDQAGIGEAAVDAVIAKITDAARGGRGAACSRTRCGRRTSTRRRTTGSGRSAARSTSPSPTSRRSTARSSSSTRRVRCRRRCRAVRSSSASRSRRSWRWRRPSARRTSTS